MRRSEINRIILESIRFFEEHRFFLPPFACYTLADWKRVRNSAREIIDLKLGWDITDFGGGDFAAKGLMLFTLRNGRHKSEEYPKPYAEKIMIAEAGQVTPMHFHWHKQEDIIVRGGSRLVIELHQADDHDALSKEPVTVSIDGSRRTVHAGDKLFLSPGESICLPQRLYHTFRAENGKCLIGEVSQVNDDSADNRFLEPAGRFPDIEEDEPVRYLLCGDYARLL